MRTTKTKTTKTTRRMRTWKSKYPPSERWNASTPAVVINRCSLPGRLN